MGRFFFLFQGTYSLLAHRQVSAKFSNNNINGGSGNANTLKPIVQEEDLKGRDVEPWDVPSWVQCGSCGKFFKPTVIEIYPRSCNKGTLYNIEDFNGVGPEAIKSEAWTDYLQPPIIVGRSTNA